MLRTFTLPIALSLAFALPAQIQIGQNEMPHAGDELNRTRANNSFNIDYGTTGPDHEWDFTDLTAAGEDITAYQSVASTNFVYAIAYADVFFNANRANHAKAGVDIAFNQLLPIDNPYTFLYHSATVYRKVGFGVELSGIPVPIIFNSPDVVYELPLDYGDVSASGSGYELNIPTLAYYGYSQERDNEVDGWGTIATPAGSFDVLRVKTTIAGHDTINLDTLSLGFNIDRPLVHEYKWLAQDLRVPVLQINTTELFGTEVVTEIFYYDLPHTIEVVQPLAATLCPGAEFELPYEATGSYNPGGFFVPSNEFIAELSDANGDFSNPTFLAQETTTESGTITVTIPLNTPPGTGYRIRVNSNSPAYTGADNGFDITIDGAAPSAVISAAGPTEFCGGGSVTLTAEPIAGSYQWRLDGTDIDGADGSSFEATASGDYTLAVTNACGADSSEAITVTVGAAPEYAFDQPAYLSCDGSPLTITAIDNSGQTDLVYEWFLNDLVLSGEDGSTLLAAEAGNYSLSVTNTVTGCSYSAAAVEVAINQISTPVVSADGPLSFCPGGSVDLSVEEVPGVSYQWSVDGAAIDGASGPGLAVATAGSYTVAGTSSGCSSASSAAVVVTIEAAPDTAVITAIDGTAFCSGGSVTLDAGNDPDLSYQWSLNGTELDGETGAQLVASAPGDYTVTVSTGAGCSATSTTTAIMENPLPAQPVITQVGDQLTTTGDGTFQWLFAGNAIDGATDTTYLPAENGNYNVTITDANGCSSTSDAFAYISTGIVQHGGEGFGLYPNPTSGLVWLKLPALASGARINVLDATGHTVIDRSITSGNTTLELQDQQAGLYFVRLLTGGVPTIVRLIVN